ncbi:TetR/AcrR family transcriptional regulator [Salinispirillum sp. LH 10-3-1]|uniref:TetR/AcrR family transcriptional regulator n=1 Tax=Salinispirillum sp. LH 10-3-1 TaxID=2952525 RepID=A0AB38YEE4_9GAMM
MNRDKKKQATRQSLLHAAQQLFREHGYDHVSTRDISVAAGVSTGTLFAHFKDKHELTKALFLQELDELLAHQTASMVERGSGLAYFEQYTQLLYTYYDQDRALSVALLQQALFEQDYYGAQMADFLAAVADRLAVELPDCSDAQRSLVAQAWMGFYFQYLFHGLSSAAPMMEWHTQLMSRCEAMLDLLR